MSVTALAATPFGRLSAGPPCGYSEKSLRLVNVNTGEQIRSIYWTPEGYVADALARIDYLLRDHHTNEVTRIDRALLDRLFDLSLTLDSRQPICVLSGYRSVKTNAALSRRVRGVAKHSYHIKGQAVDIRMQDCNLGRLRAAALKQVAGGVGYYPAKNFVHIDVGPCRQWEQRHASAAKAPCRATRGRTIRRRDS